MNEIIQRKTAAVSGGSRGIGAECVRKLALGGYEVFFTYKSNIEAASQLERELCENGYHIHAYKCDVSLKNDVVAFADIAGGCDIVINNAGVSLWGMFCDVSEDEYNRIFDTNVRGTFNMIQAFLPYMVQKKYGNIVNISSMWGVCGASCEVIYSASKAAVIGMTKALAKELGPSGIRVNCIAPGVIYTDMTKKLGDDTLSSLKDETPLNRIGTPTDIANTVMYLISDSASFVTGQVLSVDGGLTI